MNWEIGQSINRLTSANINKSLPEPNKPKEVKNDSVDVFATGSSDKITSSKFKNTTVTRISSDKSRILDFISATPNLELADSENLTLESTSMSYKGKPVTASFRLGDGEMSIQKLQYRGFDIDFFFKYPGKSLGRLFDSIDGAISFLAKEKAFKEIISTVQFDGSLGSAVIFTYKLEQEQFTYIASSDKVAKAKDFSVKSEFADLTTNEKVNPSYGAEFWSRT